jgi:hypothetical protein
MLPNRCIVLIFVFMPEMPLEIRVSSFFPVHIIGYISGGCRLIEAIFLTFVVRTQNKYEKANTYEHNLQILGGGRSSVEENLPRGTLTILKKYKISGAFIFMLAGRLRASTCELVAGEGFGG